jgi:hypothetical protein
MSIAELKELIQDLPDDMMVVLPHGEETYLGACRSESGVFSFPIPDEEEPEGFAYVDTLVLYPCTCNIEDQEVVPQEQILN